MSELKQFAAFVLTALLASAGRVAAAADVAAPSWLRTVDPIEDIRFLPEFDPADASTPEVEAVVERLRSAVTGQDARGALLAARELALPLIALDRVEFETALVLQRVGMRDELGLARELAADRPHSTYLAPNCRRDHPHVFFDMRSAAYAAEQAIEFRIGVEEARACSEDALATTRVACAEATFDEATTISTARFAGRLRVLLAGLRALPPDAKADFAMGSGGRAGALESRAATLPPEYLGVLARESAIAALPYTGSRAIAMMPAADQASALSSMAQIDAAFTSGVAARLLDEEAFAAHGGDVSALIAHLLPGDDPVATQMLLVRHLGSARHGATAALAIVRLFPDDADAIAAGVAGDAGAEPAARRRAAMMLMASGSDESRAALREFLSAARDDARFAEVCGEVRRWLGE